MSAVQLIDITDAQGNVVAPQWLVYAERVHRQLRPQIESDYAKKMKRVFAGGGRMCIAVREDQVLGVAVYRAYENTFSGHRFYIDDLVVDEKQRTHGVGRLMLTHLENRARDLGCNSFDLEASMHRTRAHKFYFREGLIIPSFAFRKTIS